MTMLIKIEEEVKNLPEQEFNKFREWFQDYESKKWDAEIEDDIKQGRLDSLAEEAINDFKNGKYRYI